jgi:hypothetical protein
MSRETMQMALEALESDPISHAGLVSRKQAITALRQALSGEAVKHIKTWHERCEEHPDHQERIISERMIQARMQEEIDELRQALETEQEPVAWANSFDLQNFDMKVRTCPDLHHTVPLYTAPPKREWVGLTDEEIHDMSGYEEDRKMYRFARAIEAKLKEKNHG